jgi:hypothetical protein
MTTKQLPADFPEVQGAIYRVALSLDSFLVNGIQYGVLQPVVSDGFLERTTSSLLTDLASLEGYAPNAPAATQPKITELLASLRTSCQQLIDLVLGLCSFRTLPPEHVRSAVSQIPILRKACVQRIQELEGCFPIPQRFYESRPAHSTAAVDDFLSTLGQCFAEERNASG